MNSDITLPLKADTAAAPLLLAELLSRKGNPCRIDASACQGIGAICASILLSARLSWQRENSAFTILGAANLTADLTLLGMADLLSDMEMAK